MEPLYYPNFNAVLFRAIHQKYRSQDAFAKVVGCSQSSVSYIVLGEHSISDENKRCWADALDSTVEELFGEAVEV